MNSRAIKRQRADPRNEVVVVPFTALRADQRRAGQKTCQERDSQINEDALRDLANRYVHDCAMQTEFGRQNRDEQPCIHGIQEHLKQRVERHQTGGIFGVALGELVPHDDHGDAPGQTDHDQPGHVFGVSAQEDDGEHEHEDRADDPVLHQGKPQHALVAEDLAEFLVADLGKRRVHHYDQADGNRNRCCAHAEFVEEGHDSGNQPTGDNTERHGRKDPGGQVTIKKTQARCNSVRHLSYALGEGEVFDRASAEYGRHSLTVQEPVAIAFFSLRESSANSSENRNASRRKPKSNL